MNRRQLLQRLSLLPALGLVASPGRASPAQLVIQQSPLAGFQYHEGERPLEGQSLQLIREPNNPYDTRAVRVDWRGQRLGYIPARQNHAVAQVADRGQILYARIASLAVDDNPWKRVVLEISL